MANELSTAPAPTRHPYPSRNKLEARSVMISYFEAARELDVRWTGSLQFLPPTPMLRTERDCFVARQIATTEVDLFIRYAREIAVSNRLNFRLLLDYYDMLLAAGVNLQKDSSTFCTYLSPRTLKRCAFAEVQAQRS